MKNKYEIEVDLADALFVQFLRYEADIVWHALRYGEKQEASGKATESELADMRYNWQLLGAMYILEEYYSDNPEIRTKYPREVTYEE